MRKAAVTLAVFIACQAIAADPSTTRDEYDAAAIAITAYRLEQPIDHHVVSVLQGYVQRQAPTQDRYGK